MKRLLLAVAAAGLAVGLIAVAQPVGGGGGGQVAEFASVRFMEERTAIIWPDGSVQNVLEIMGDKKFPGTSEKYRKGADFRMYWLTTAMNVMGKRKVF